MQNTVNQREQISLHHILPGLHRFHLQCLVERNKAGDDHQDDGYEQGAPGKDLDAKQQALHLQSGVQAVGGQQLCICQAVPLG